MRPSLSLVPSHCHQVVVCIIVGSLSCNIKCLEACVVVIKIELNNILCVLNTVLILHIVSSAKSSVGIFFLQKYNFYACQTVTFCIFFTHIHTKK